MDGASLPRYFNSTDLKDLDSCCLAELKTSPDGDCRLRLIASELCLGNAVELARKFAVECEGIVLVGCTERHAVEIEFPVARRVGVDRLNAAAIVQSWISWLRAASVIRFGELSVDNPEQCIPPEYLADRDIREALRIVLVSQSVRIGWPDDPRRPTSRDWIEAAPARSIAGLLRSAQMAAYFVEWLDAAPLSVRPKFLIPLYGTTAPDCARDAGLRFGLSWWHADGHIADVICGHMLHLTIDAHGNVACQDFPADRFGIGWSPPDHHVATCRPDLIYRRSINLDFSGLLSGIPELVRTVLIGIARLRRTLHEAQNRRFNLGTREEFEQFQEFEPDFYSITALMMDYIKIKIRADIEAIRESVRVHCFPFDGTATTLGMNHFLFANGDPGRQMRRRQALQSFPLVATEGAKGRLPCAVRAVDSAQPLYAALRSDIDGSAWAIRRARDVSLQAQVIEETGFRNLGELVQMLLLLGPHTPLPDNAALKALAASNSSVQVATGPAAEEQLAKYRTALTQAAGRQARTVGWAVAVDGLRLLERDPATRYVIMAYLHDAAGIVIDVLSRHFARTFSPDDSIVQHVLSAWFADTPLSRLMSSSKSASCESMCIGCDACHGGDTAGRQNAATSEDAPFGHCSLLPSRVEAQVLMTADELLAESNAMTHCVHSYANEVANFDVLIVALTDPASAQRATVELRVDQQQFWRELQIKGPGNTEVANTCRLARAAAHVCSLLNQQPSLLCADKLARYHVRSKCEQTSLANYRRQGMLVVSRLPKPWRARVEALFPGVGPLESRVLHALRKCERSNVGRMP